MISYFLLLLCVWASCCMCWLASSLLPPWSKQRSDLNSLSHVEGTVGYLSFPQLPASTKLVRTSCLWDIYPLRQMWFISVNVFENYLREEGEEANLLMSRTYSLKLRLIMCFLTTKKSGKSSSINILTEAGKTLGVWYNSSPCRDDISYTNKNTMLENTYFCGCTGKMALPDVPVSSSALFRGTVILVYLLFTHWAFFFFSLGMP